jgi:aspartate/methionine/tyrosine aminotransferase
MEFQSKLPDLTVTIFSVMTQLAVESGAINLSQGFPDFEFARRLTAQHGVAAIPPSAFYHQKDDHKVLRFCFAKKSETLERAAKKRCRV